MQATDNRSQILTNRIYKSGITALLIVIVALSWNRYLDDAAQTATLDHFKRALAVAAIARGFNGIVSVAQGTEVAIQPVGVGVTLTIGEILDPLNDLIERFSALALLASVALGVQLTLGQILSTPWLSGLLTAAACAYLVLLWRAPGKLNGKLASFTARALAMLVFFRFLLATMLLITQFIDQNFLAAKQDLAMAELTQASSNIEQLQEQQKASSSESPEGDLFDRTAAQISNFLDTSRQTLDLEAQLADVEAEIENSAEEIVNLIVIFLLQTLLLPIGSLWLGWRVLTTFWRSTRTPP